MKLHLPTLKPRNPHVVPSLRRTAGSHRPGPGAQRQSQQRALREELQRLRHSP